MIRIAHVITTLQTGGAEIMLTKLLSAIDRSRFENQVFALTSIGAPGKRLEELGISVEAFGLSASRPNPFVVTRLASRLRKARPQIVQTWLYHADLLGWFAARAAGIPSVIWNIRRSQPKPEDGSVQFRLIVRTLAALSRKPAAVVVNSAAGQDAHERLGFRPREWKLIPNGFDTDVFAPSSEAREWLRQDLEVAPDALLIGLIARYEPIKDHDNFLTAASLLLQSRRDVHFVLVGRDVDERNAALGRRVAELGLGANIHLLGQREDMPRITAALDVVSLSSAGEGFPNVVGEAMSAGVPCVVTDVGDCRWLVGDTGLVVPPKDPAAMCRAWHELLEIGPDARRELGAAARRKIQASLSLGAVVSQYEELYERIASRGTFRRT